MGRLVISTKSASAAVARTDALAARIKDFASPRALLAGLVPTIRGATPSTVVTSALFEARMVATTSTELASFRNHIVEPAASMTSRIGDWKRRRNQTT